VLRISGLPAVFVVGEVGAGLGQPVATDAVVGDAAQVQVAAVLAHRGDHGVVLAAQVPQRLQHLAALAELQHAAGVDVGEQPFVHRHALGHAAAKARHAHGQVIGRRAHAHQGHPVVAVRGQIDVVGVARQVVQHQLDLALARPSNQ
jgi:hypothetical protein